MPLLPLLCRLINQGGGLIAIQHMPIIVMDTEYYCFFNHVKWNIVQHVLDERMGFHGHVRLVLLICFLVVFWDSWWNPLVFICLVWYLIVCNYLRIGHTFKIPWWWHLRYIDSGDTKAALLMLFLVGSRTPPPTCFILAIQAQWFNIKYSSGPQGEAKLNFIVFFLLWGYLFEGSDLAMWRVKGGL